MPYLRNFFGLTIAALVLGGAVVLLLVCLVSYLIFLGGLALLAVPCHWLAQVRHGQHYRRVKRPSR